LIATDQPYVARLLYEILSDEKFLHIKREGWAWTGALGDFDCSIGTTSPPVLVATSSSAVDEPEPVPSTPDGEPGPTLIALPKFREGSVDKVRPALEELLNGWAAHLEVTEGLAIRFEFRGAWTLDPRAEDQTPALATYVAAGGGSFEVFKPMTEAPDPPPPWMTREPELVRMLREQWRGVRTGEARILDRAYFCLTAIEAAYGGRKGASEALHVSGAFLSRIGQLAATQDRAHARKLTGSGPATFSQEDRQWLNDAIPQLILRCAEVELGRADLALLSV
jgi:hypothetical protein